MSANEHIEELLSGFLDGELNAAELCELEAAMSANAALGLKPKRTWPAASCIGSCISS